MCQTANALSRVEGGRYITMAWAKQGVICPAELSPDLKRMSYELVRAHFIPQYGERGAQKGGQGDWITGGSLHLGPF